MALERQSRILLKYRVLYIRKPLRIELGSLSY